MRARALLLLTLVLLWSAPAAQAQTDAQPGAETGAPSTGSAVEIDSNTILNLLKHGNLTMWALLGCSVLTVSFILERLIVLRSNRVIPATFVDRFMDRLRDDALDRKKALKICRQNGSPIAQILGIIVRHWGRPAAEIRQAVADRADTVLYPLRRRVRALGGMATMSPLLGLFGTVLGMIKAFAHTSSVQALAEGISLALVATASGLAIAIVSAAAYYFLLGRVDRLIQEMDVLAEEVIDHVAVERPGSAGVKPRPRVLGAAKQASV